MTPNNLNGRMLRTINTINFRANAKVESLVGRELITTNTIAMFELVKNAYDAGATRVDITLQNFEMTNKKNISTDSSRIIVTDNGFGMTFDDVKNYWMELGTPHKETKREITPKQRQMEIISKRTVNGEKGIGRFGVDKIASKLTLMTIDNDKSEKTVVKFDWNKFDDREKLLQEIGCEYSLESVDYNESSGTSLIMYELRDVWTLNDYKELERALSKFISPIPFENDVFKIYLHIESDGLFSEFTKETIEIKNETFDYLNVKIKGFTNENGSLGYEIESKGETKEKNIIENYLKEINENKTFETLIGNIKFEIFYLDASEKKVFSRKMGLRTSDYGNIKIFRDNFRIHPYGEPENDWLGIDRRHAQGMFRTFGTRDLIGYVALEKTLNPKENKFKEATSRVGLIEDVEAFEVLKEVTWFLIIQLQTFIFKKLKEEAKTEVSKIKVESSDLKYETLKMMATINEMIGNPDQDESQRATLINSIKEQSQQILNKVEVVEKASIVVEDRIRIFNQITQKENMLFEMLHTIKNKLNVMDSISETFILQIEDYDKYVTEGTRKSIRHKKKLLEEIQKDILKLINGSLEKVNMSKLKKEKLDFIELMNSSLDAHKDLFRQNGITVQLNLNLDVLRINASVSGIKIIFENLISNAVKALKDSESKLICIDVSKSKVSDDKMAFEFSDNGCGIPESKKGAVFTLWNSSTGGTGIGLYTIKEIVDDLKGEIDLIEPTNQGMITSFLITLPIVKRG